MNNNHTANSKWVDRGISTRLSIITTHDKLDNTKVSLTAVPAYTIAERQLREAQSEEKKEHERKNESPTDRLGFRRQVLGLGSGFYGCLWI